METYRGHEQHRESRSLDGKAPSVYEQGAARIDTRRPFDQPVTPGTRSSAVKCATAYCSCRSYRRTPKRVRKVTSGWNGILPTDVAT
jgi:hypothetical protein